MPPVRRDAPNAPSQSSQPSVYPHKATGSIDREQFLQRIGAARKAQVDKREAGRTFKDLGEYAGYAIPVVELRIEENVPLSYGLRTMLRVVDDEGTQFYCGTQAAIDNAVPIIETLGEGPYPVPVPMFVASRKTRHGGTVWLEIAEWETPAASQAPAPEQEPEPF